MVGAVGDSPTEKDPKSGNEQQNDSLSGSDSEDDGPIVRRKKTTSHSALQDSSEDEAALTQNEKESANKLSLSSDDEFDGIDTSAIKSSTPVVRRIKNKRLMKVIDSSDDDDDLTYDSPRPVVKNPGKKFESIASSGSESEGDKSPSKAERNKLDDNSEKFTSIQPKKNLMDDLFDAEDSSDDDRASKKEESEKEQNSEEEEEEEEEMELSAALRKKLAKGASKKPSKERTAKPQRPTREDIQEIHSESQRLIRESRASVPYHMPAKVGLNVFLERTKKKQEAFKALANPRAAIKVPSLALLGQSSLTINKRPKEIPTKKPALEKVVEDLTKDSNENSKEQLKEEVKKQLFGESEKLLDTDATLEQKDAAQTDSCVMDTNEDTVCKVVVLESNEQERTGDIVKVLPAKEQTVDLTTPSKSSPVPEDSGYVTHIHTSEEETSGQGASQTEAAVASQDSQVPTSKALESAYTPKATREDSTQEDTAALLQQSQSATTEAAKSEHKASGKVVPKVAGVMPRLSGGPDDFVDLEDEEEKAPSQGITQLMQRLMKHSTKKVRKPADVTVSTVSKIKGEANEKDELKLETFTYKVGEHDDEEEEDHTPGAKLLRLKEKLAVQMKQKREEARELRKQMYSMDNEEGYDEQRQKEAEEEAELTDQTDTDEEHYDEEEEEIEEEEEAVVEEKEKERNPFADEEAEDEDEGDDDQEDIREEDLHLALGSPDVSQQCEPREFLRAALQKQKTMVLFNDDDSQSTASIQHVVGWNSERPFQQLNHSFSNSKPADLSKDLSFEGSLIPAAQIESSRPHMLLPLDDESMLVPPSQRPLTDDPCATQLLDADGLFKTNSSSRPNTRGTLLQPNNSMEEDDLLDLCSGKFTGTTQEENRGFSNRFPKSQNQGDDIDELLGLCSGQFSTQRTQQQQQRGNTTQATQVKTQTQMNNTGPFGSALKLNESEEETEQPDSPVKVKSKKGGRAVIVDDDDEDTKQEEEEDDDGNESFEATSDNEVEDDEEAEEKVTLDSDEEVEEDKENAEPKKRKRAEFFDEEAELSGSEMGSADEDEGDEDDELERMSGDDEEVDEEELRNQVGRMHHKLELDEGQRALQHLQEMLLPDGDLTDGKGRTRKFKWKNVDEDTQQDLFHSDNEDGGEEEKEVSEDKWRKERHEREKFLQEQAEAKAQAPEEEDSQLLKLGKVIFKSKKSSDTIFKVPSLKKSTHGSFLKRSAADLAKIAEMSKPVTNVNGPRNSRNFVFQAMSPDAKEAPVAEEEEEKKPKRRAHVKRALSVQQPATNKRPKLDKSNSIPADSIFNLLQ